MKMSKLVPGVMFFLVCVIGGMFAGCGVDDVVDAIVDDQTECTGWSALGSCQVRTCVTYTGASVDSRFEVQGGPTFDCNGLDCGQASIDLAAHCPTN